MAGTWLYVRGSESLEIRRWDCDVGGRLVVVEKGHRSEEAFDEVSDVIEAQRRLEHVLREAGWALEDFYPDRRTGFDRRTAARDSDRRCSRRR